MRISRIRIRNFRGIKNGELLLPEHAALIGDNNCGKSTVLEAIDLCLGPERLAKRPVVDEHDFYAGCYLEADGQPTEIVVEVVIVDLNDEQKRHFQSNLEWWNRETNALLDGPPPEATDAHNVIPALRIGFSGAYDREEDDFTGRTYFLSPDREDGGHDPFRTSDKRQCGFLFLRTLRTGSRALSLERGSLLDIILRLQNKSPQMWEDVLVQLRRMPVAEKEELGISDLLAGIQNAIRSFVPAEWADNPHMRVSDLTREHLRRVLTVFLGTGATSQDGAEYAAPFQHQGTGTINTLVLALLSLIAEIKQNVIFAMEEPEIAIPPHTQKRIVDSVCKKSAQAIFTTHSPFVLRQFSPSQIVVLQRSDGTLSAVTTEYPPAVKPKAYRVELNSRFCEALLARRVLILEGQTEYEAFPAAAARLNELHPDEFKTLEELGIATIDARTDSQIAPLGNYFKKLGKTVFAVFDQQEAGQQSQIMGAVHHGFESSEKGFERLVINGTAEAALRRFAVSLVTNNAWPTHLTKCIPAITTALDDLRSALFDYFVWSKGEGTVADLLSTCNRSEIPSFIVDTLLNIGQLAESPRQPAETYVPGYLI